MKTLSKSLIGTVAAGAMALTAAAPAQAQWRDRDDRRHRDRGGIDVGDVIAGALIIGGIAAVAGAANRGRGYYDNDRYYDRGYNDDPRAAVEQCVYAAERNASRYSYRGAQVTDIRQVEQRRDGYIVRGRIAVDQQNRNWRRGWGNDYRGWDNRYSGYDAGRFTCRVQYGRVVDLDYSGIRGI
jgi:hypothetical protein